MATKHNAVPEGRDAEALLDADLAILAAQPERFREYEQQVRIEYSWVPEAWYRTERAKVLRQFLTRQRLFATAYFRGHYEAQARQNLEHSLAALTA
jgi:predicted metal-dependent HD superfamily phosphohydrolase